MTAEQVTDGPILRAAYVLNWMLGEAETSLCATGWQEFITANSHFKTEVSTRNNCYIKKQPRCDSKPSHTVSYLCHAQTPHGQRSERGLVTLCELQHFLSGAEPLNSSCCTCSRGTGHPPTEPDKRQHSRDGKHRSPEGCKWQINWKGIS